MIPKREFSNQFPRKQDIEHKTINERANIIFSGLEENLNRLHEYIMFPERREKLNKTYYENK